MRSQDKAELAVELSKHSVHLRDQGYWSTAVTVGKRALALSPSNPGIWSNHGNVLISVGKIREGKEATEQAIKLNPNLVECHHNLGLALFYLGRLDDAIEEFSKAEHKFLDAAFDKACAYMLKGEWETGWQALEIRQAKNRLPVFGMPKWDGKEFTGTLWVTSEQGHGDMIQFARYLPWARSKCSRLIFDCFPQLLSLFQGYPGVDEFRAWEPEGVTEPDADYHVSIQTLAKLYGTTIDNVPSDPGHFTQAAAAFPATTVGDPDILKVGICWAGNPKYLRDKSRSTSLDKMLTLGANPDVQLYSLQVGPRSLDGNKVLATSLLNSVETQLTSWYRTAALMVRLDLVVSVDTAVAHLAGALDIPTWVLLPKVPDWRWLTKREDTPWYPSMRLFRQDRWDDWDGVMDRVSRALVKFVDKRRSETQAAAD